LRDESEPDVIRLTFECEKQEAELLLAAAYEAGTLGVIEEDTPAGRGRLHVFLDESSSDGADFLAGWRAKAICEDQVEVSSAVWPDWSPQPVGKRFFLVPPWLDAEAPEGRLRLTMPPGSAPGTGLHPATQLALEGLERCLTPHDRVLDLGTGSGILAAGAGLLGAGTVFACDLDTEVLAQAKAYLGTVPLFAGSCRALRNSCVDLVVANLSQFTLAAVAGEIARVLAPSGRAVISGFTCEQAESVLRNFPMPAETILTRDGWAAAILRKPGGNVR